MMWLKVLIYCTGVLTTCQPATVTREVISYSSGQMNGIYGAAAAPHTKYVQTVKSLKDAWVPDTCPDIIISANREDTHCDCDEPKPCKPPKKK